jgi:cob(I)alamin adenosyltransferase
MIKPRVNFELSLDEGPTFIGLLACWLVIQALLLKLVQTLHQLKNELSTQHTSSMIHILIAICHSSEDRLLYYMDSNAEDNPD